MGLPFTEDFDESGLSGALPAGWDGGALGGSTVAAENGVTPTSGAQMARIICGVGTESWITYGTPDGNSGDVRVQADVNCYSGTQKGIVGVALRGSSSSLDTSASSYDGWYDFATGVVGIDLWRSSSDTTLASLTAASNPPGWKTLTFAASGPTLTLTVYDIGTAKYLNSSGAWQSGSAVAITRTDTTLSGSGYYGLYAQSPTKSQTAYFDTLAASAGTGPSPILLQPPRVLLPGHPRRRGRVVAPPLARTPPNPPTLAAPIFAASPRILRGGRLYLPGNPGPFAAPTPIDGTPLRGLMARPDPSGPSRHHPGTVVAGAIARAASAPTSGPIVPHIGALAYRNVAGRRGSASIGRWLPPDPLPAAPQPWAGLLKPTSRREPAPHRGAIAASPKLTLGVTPDWPAFFGPFSVIWPVVQVRHRHIAGRILIPRSPSLATPYVPGPTVPPLSRSAMRPVGRRERPRPAVIPAWLGGGKRLTIGPGLYYNIYMSPGPGRPIDYANAVAVTAGLAWTSAPLAVLGQWGFGVRAMNQWGEELNLDCEVAVLFDAAGRDITGVPSPPVALRAIPRAGGAIDVIWSYPAVAAVAKRPAGFRVYSGTGAAPDYSTPIATVAANAAILGGYRATFAGSDGTTYLVGVRAYNASGEESNTVAVPVVADATGPLPVSGLAIATRP